MDKKDFRTTIANIPGRENAVVEICYRDEQWVEMSEETPHEYVIQFYDKSDADYWYWEFTYDEAMEVLDEIGFKGWNEVLAEAKELLAKYQRTAKEIYELLTRVIYESDA